MSFRRQRSTSCAIEGNDDGHASVMKGKETHDTGWVAFNIDADGNQFDFTVALGGSTVGYRTPDSTQILLTKLTDKAICRVSIQPAGRGPRTDARRLEIICPWHGDDELDLAAECVQQLSTALRLYKPSRSR
jgi:hypothetical protein